MAWKDAARALAVWLDALAREDNCLPPFKGPTHTCVQSVLIAQALQEPTFYSPMVEGEFHGRTAAHTSYCSPVSQRRGGDPLRS